MYRVVKWRVFAATLFFILTVFFTCGLAKTPSFSEVLDSSALLFWQKPVPTKEDIRRYAEFAGRKTGIDPDLLLAVAMQESNIGTNIGSCYLFRSPGRPSDRGINRKTGKIFPAVMKRERDFEAFLRIMEELERDPYSAPLSCPLKIGWGGAMGPMQILPSIWIMVGDRAALHLKKKIADPWNMEDAIMAAAVHIQDLMKCLDATRNTSAMENNTTCMYYSGKICEGQTRFVTRYRDAVSKKKAILSGRSQFVKTAKTKPVVKKKIVKRAKSISVKKKNSARKKR